MTATTQNSDCHTNAGRARRRKTATPTESRHPNGKTVTLTQNRHPDEKTVTLNLIQGLSNPTIHLPQIPDHAQNDRYHISPSFIFY